MREQLLGPLESKIMDYLWRTDGPVTISQVHRYISRYEKIAYTTVATIVGRLVQKKLLIRAKKDGDYTYACRKSQQEFKTERSRNLAKFLLGSFGEVAIASFVAEVSTDPESLRKLRELANGRQ